MRGVPDGCGLEMPLSPAKSVTSVNSVAGTSGSIGSIPIPSPHELLNLKKGWLMKQGLTKDWQKHWFVLQGSALMYFRDPVAENNGLMDGIIDLGLVQKVSRRITVQLGVWVDQAQVEVSGLTIACPPI